MRNTIKNRFLIGLGTIGIMMFFAICFGLIFFASERGSAMEPDVDAQRQIDINYENADFNEDYAAFIDRWEGHKLEVKEEARPYIEAMSEHIINLKNLDADTTYHEGLFPTKLQTNLEKPVFHQPAPQTQQVDQLEGISEADQSEHIRRVKGLSITDQ